MAGKTNNGELIKIFYEETQELIEDMRQEMLGLSQTELCDRSCVYCRLFRCAHIIKGSSSSVGFDELKNIAQALEIIFKEACDERFIISNGVSALLCEGVEACQKLLNGEEIANHKELLDKLNSILQTSWR